MTNWHGVIYAIGHAVMAQPGFRWTVGMLAFTSRGFVRVTALDGGLPAELMYDHLTGRTVAVWLRETAVPVFSDQETARLLEVTFSASGNGSLQPCSTT